MATRKKPTPPAPVQPEPVKPPVQTLLPATCVCPHCNKEVNLAIGVGLYVVGA